MKNKLFKTVISLIVILVILIVIMIISLLVINNIEKKKYDYDPNYSEPVNDRNLEEVCVNEEYATIKNCINKYYNIKNNFSETEQYQGIKEQLIEEYSNNLLCILDQEYIQKNNIQLEDIKKQNNKYSYKDFLIHDMYVYDNGDKMAAYFVYGKEIDYLKKDSITYGYIVKIDKENQTFSLYPYQYMEENNYININEIVEVDINMTISIDKNMYNHFEYYNPTIEEIVKQVFLDYKLNMSYDINYAYDLLDDTYSKKRFRDFYDFKEFVKNRKDISIKSELLKYEVNKEKDYTEYICMDNLGNYFIFRQTSDLKYNVILDIYTLERKEFVSKYENSNQTSKVALNVEKFKQMINMKDYNAAYSKLDETFRENNFGSVEKFKDYIEKNWFNCNKFSYNEVNPNENVFTIDMRIYDAINENESVFLKTMFIMKLKEGTDFVMSFEI